MQKVITVSVDLKHITKKAGSAFSINEVEGLNEWLALGWQIEEWNFLKEGEADGDIVLLVILNDDALYEDDKYLADDFDPNSEDQDDFSRQ